MKYEIGQKPPQSSSPPYHINYTNLKKQKCFKLCRPKKMRIFFKNLRVGTNGKYILYICARFSLSHFVWVEQVFFAVIKFLFFSISMSGHKLQMLAFWQYVSINGFIEHTIIKMFFFRDNVMSFPILFFTESEKKRKHVSPFDAIEIQSGWCL